LICRQAERILGPDGTPKKLQFYAHSGGARGLICTLCDVALKAMRDDAGIAGRMVAFLAGGLTTILEVRVHHKDEPTDVEVTSE